MNSYIYIVAPLDLKLLAATPTTLNLTVIPPKNFGGHWFEMNFKDGKYPTQCYVNIWNPAQYCIYRDLTPATQYTFKYYVGSIPGGLDIRSETKYKSFITPS